MKDFLVKLVSHIVFLIFYDLYSHYPAFFQHFAYGNLNPSTNTTTYLIFKLFLFLFNNNNISIFQKSYK